jgi:hypothetical protein
VSASNESWDIFEEHHGGFTGSYEFDEGWPDGSLVFGPESFTGDGIRLAWQSRSDDVHASTKLACWEIDQIAAENRRRLHGRVFHPRQDVGRCTGLPAQLQPPVVLQVGQA